MLQKEKKRKALTIWLKNQDFQIDIPEYPSVEILLDTFCKISMSRARDLDQLQTQDFFKKKLEEIFKSKDIEKVFSPSIIINQSGEGASNSGGNAIYANIVNFN